MIFQRKVIASLALGIASLGSLAAAQNVTTDYDHTVSFANYHTYSWSRVTTSNPLNIQRVKDAVQRDLSARGWQMVPQGGDVSITAIGATQNQQEYNTFYTGLGGFGWRRGWGGGGFGDTTTTVEQIPVGTLVLDIYDSSSKKLLWRGMATDTLSNKPDKNMKKLDKAVDKLLDKFPPKVSQ